MTRKNILFICQYFYPEVFRGNDIAFHWAKQGHKVHVVTGIPNYPGGKFFDGYGLFKKRKEYINGVRVTHLPIVPRANNKVMLMLNYFSYYIVACIYVLFHSIGHKYDFVFCQQLSPVMMSAPAVLYKRLRGVPLYTWVLDLWPESLAAASGINNKYIIGIFRWFVKQEYLYSDKILTSSKSFYNSINEYGNYNKKIIHYPQWSDYEVTTSTTMNLKDVLNKNGFEESRLFEPGCFYIMFAGAVGEAHGMECNMKAALLTKRYKNIKWIIIGDGRRLPWVKACINEHGLEDTVFTLGKFSSDMMRLFFEKADVMLVSLNDSPLFNLYSPAKISSYMAAGKPIVACVNGECADIVREAACGWTIPSGDAKALAKTVVDLSKMDKSVLCEKGENGREFYEKYYDKKKSLKRLDTIIGL